MPPLHAAGGCAGYCGFAGAGGFPGCVAGGPAHAPHAPPNLLHLQLLMLRRRQLRARCELLRIECELMQNAYEERAIYIEQMQGGLREAGGWAENGRESCDATADSSYSQQQQQWCWQQQQQEWQQQQQQQQQHAPGTQQHVWQGTDLRAGKRQAVTRSTSSSSSCGSVCNSSTAGA